MKRILSVTVFLAAFGFPAVTSALSPSHFSEETLHSFTQNLRPITDVLHLAKEPFLITKDIYRDIFQQTKANARNVREVYHDTFSALTPHITKTFEDTKKTFSRAYTTSTDNLAQVTGTRLVAENATEDASQNTKDNTVENEPSPLFAYTEPQIPLSSHTNKGSPTSLPPQFTELTHEMRLLTGALDRFPAALSGNVTSIVRELEAVAKLLKEKELGGASSLTDLETQLTNKIANLEARLGTGTASSRSSGQQITPASNFRAIALTNRIDQLTNTTINSPQISGGTITDTTITGSTFSGSSGSFSGNISAQNLTLSGALTVDGTGTSTIAGDVRFDTDTLVIDSINNRIGIGTTSPTDTFSLAGAAYLAPVSAPSTTTGRLYNVSGDLYWAGSLIGGSAIASWTTDGTHAWRVSGNVGIGTSSPYAKLSVAGETVSEYFTATSTTATTTLAGGFAVGGNSFTILQNGNVGIGTTSPSYPFSVQGNTYIKGDLRVNGNTQISDSGELTVGDKVISEGEIGVGTSSPYAKLGIQNTTAAQTAFSIFGAASQSAPLFDVFNNSNQNLLRLTAAGNIGLGTTSPYAKLSVAGDAVIDGTLTASTFSATSSISAPYFTATDSSATSTFAGGLTGPNDFTIQSSSGRVGIGTNAPSAPLHVSDGAILASGTTGSTPISGSGTRMMWIPDKAAFRAGYVDGTQWDAGNIGMRSLAVGGKAKASGQDSIAIGWNNIASNAYSTAIGVNNDVSAYAGVGIGLNADVTSTNFGISLGNYVSVLANNGYAFGNLLTSGNSGMTLGYGSDVSNRYTNNQANSIGFATKSTIPILFLSASNGSATVGNVGVGGDTTPDFALEVATTSSNGFLGISSQPGNDGDIFVINPSGNVGIGTTSPYAKLSVTNTGSGPSFVVEDSTSPDSTPFVIDSAGRVGVGTESPWAKLHIYETNKTITGVATDAGSIGKANLSIVTSDSYGQDVGGVMGLGGAYSSAGTRILFGAIAGRKLNGTNSNAGGYLGFYTNDSSVGLREMMRIDNIGNVGIGTTSPYTKLSVAGEVVASHFTATSTTATSTLAGGLNVGSGGLVYDRSTGRVGVGTTDPQSAKLRVSGGNIALDNEVALQGRNGTDSGYIDLIKASSGNGISIGSNWAVITSSSFRTNSAYTYTQDSDTGMFSGGSGSDVLFFQTGGTERMRIDNVGNVGIGTTSPYAKLSVAGETVAEYFTATSTTATSTFAGGFSVGSGALVYDPVANTTSIERLNLGNMKFGDDAGAVSWIDMSITSSASAGTPMAYSAMLDNSKILTVAGAADGAGNVGSTTVHIGTTTTMYSSNLPGVSLTLGYGALCVDNGGDNCDDSVRNPGEIYAVNTTVQSVDLAENFPTKDKALTGGKIVMIDPDNPVFVKTYDPNASDPIPLGIVSEAPGFLLGGFNHKEFEEELKVPVALAGRVPLEVTLENGEIRPGDRIAPSETVPGAGRKAEAGEKTVGIALERYAAGSGKSKIVVFVNLAFSKITLPSEEELVEDMDEKDAGSLARIAGMFKKVGITIKKGMISLTELVVDTITARRAKIETLEMKDAATGETYCVRIVNGEWEKFKGGCGDVPTQGVGDPILGEDDPSPVSEGGSEDAKENDGEAGESDEAEDVKVDEEEEAEETDGGSEDDAEEERDEVSDADNEDAARDDEDGIGGTMEAGEEDETDTSDAQDSDGEESGEADDEESDTTVKEETGSDSDGINAGQEEGGEPTGLEENEEIKKNENDSTEE